VRGHGCAHSRKSWFEPRKPLEANETRASPIGNETASSPNLPQNLPKVGDSGERQRWVGSLEPAGETVLRSKLWIDPPGNQS